MKEWNVTAVTPWTACGKTGLSCPLPGRAGVGPVVQVSEISSRTSLPVCSRCREASSAELARGLGKESRVLPLPEQSQVSPPKGTIHYCWACGCGLEPSLDKETKRVLK